MQEDLHEGMGRRRKKASIGLHDLDAIRFPLRYTIVDRDYSFIPLGETNQKSIRVILEESETGRLYSHILAGSEKCPLIVDSSGTVLSLPPIINGSATKVDENTRNLFVEVTATSRSVGQDALAILAVTLHDAGFGIQSVAIRQGKSRLRTPVMTPRKVKTDVSYVNSVLGLELAKRVGAPVAFLYGGAVPRPAPHETLCDAVDPSPALACNDDAAGSCARLVVDAHREVRRTERTRAGVGSDQPVEVIGRDRKFGRMCGEDAFEHLRHEHRGLVEDLAHHAS